MSRIISFVSACGGIGKTSIIYEVSKIIAKNKKVCVFDSYFGMNNLSLRFEKENDIDFKDYLTGRLGTYNVLNKVNNNLFYIKTNSVNFDYLKHAELIKFFLYQIAEDFDFLLIDVNCFNLQTLDLMLDVSNEAIVIVSDDETCVRNSAKLIQKINTVKDIYNTNLLINKVRSIKSIKRKCLSEVDISEILKCEVIFSIPKLYNFNRYFNQFIYKFAYSIIKNKNISYKFYSKYKGILGYIRRIKYAKFE